MSDASPPPDDVPQNRHKCSESSPPMCHAVPSENPPMCHAMPSQVAPGDAKCASECRELPNSANFDEDKTRCKTNPPKIRPLTDVQLAVARWVVAGHGSSRIARQFGLNHHTIGRWKRDPRIAAVIERLRARADAAVVELRAKRDVGAAARRPHDNVDNRARRREYQ